MLVCRLVGDVGWFGGWLVMLVGLATGLRFVLVCRLVGVLSTLAIWSCFSALSFSSKLLSQFAPEHIRMLMDLTMHLQLMLAVPSSLFGVDKFTPQGPF